MSWRRAFRAPAILAWTALAWGCVGSQLPVIGQHADLQVHAVRSIKTLRIKQVAVMPLLEAPAQGVASIAPGASSSVSAELYGQILLTSEWRVVAQSQVDEALRNLPEQTVNNQQKVALALGKAVGADGVFFGTIDTYRERIGIDYAAAKPAAVGFTLNFLYVPLNQIIWTGRFSKEQRALSENLFALPDFLRNYGRWIRAHEIAERGIKEAVNDLRSRLPEPEKVKVFGKSSSYQKTLSQRQQQQNMKASMAQ
jgi:hypothetical protein